MNNEVFFILHNLANQSKIFDFFILFCAEYLPYFAVIFLFFYFLYKDVGSFDWKNPFYIIKKRFRNIFNVFTPAILGWIVVSILKSIFSKPRPFVKFKEIVEPLFVYRGMDSFPSGHSVFFMALAVSLFFVEKRIAFVYIIIALIIGIARVISGVHFPIDIIFGWIIGLIVGLIFVKFFKR